jgi:transcriptional regulator with XRE-family HTH domain
MNGQTACGADEIAAKIAQLVEERGWTQDHFARLANLNRTTVREILVGNGPRRFRNGTISACARALGLTVDELRRVPADILVTWKAGQGDPESAETRLYELATQPEFLAWVERHPDRARQLSAQDVDELLSIQATGGPLSEAGVEHFVGLLERKRKLIHQVHVVAGTEYLDFLEKFVTVLYEKVQAYPDRR